MAKKIQTNFAIRIATETAELRKGLNEATQSFKSFESKIMTGVKVFAGMFTADAVLNFSQKVINSAQGMGDEWDKVMKGMDSANQFFFKSLATGDFSNFLEGVKAAVQAGIEYSKVLDDLGDRMRVLKIEEADARGYILQRMKILRDEMATNDERIKAADEIIAKEDELAQKRARNAKIEYDAELNRMAALTKLSNSQLEYFLKSYESQENLRSAAEEYLNTEKALQALYRTATEPSDFKRIREFQSLLEQGKGNEQLMEWVDLLKGIGKTTDEELDKLVDLYSKWKDAENSALENTLRVHSRKSALLDENRRLETTTQKDIKKSIDETNPSLKIQVDLLKAANKYIQDIYENQKMSGDNIYNFAMSMAPADEESDDSEYNRLIKRSKALEDFSQAFSGLTNVFQYTLQSNENILDAFLGYFKTWIKSMIIELSALAAASAILSALTGGSFGAAFSALGGSKFSGLFKGGMATGGISSGGLYEVGEAGRELVALPSGARVFNHADTERMIGNSGGEWKVRIEGDDLVAVLSKKAAQYKRF